MRLGRSALLDALSGEYLLGTLRGPARKRFERALRDEPLVALRVKHWETMFAPRFAAAVALQPAAGGWKRLTRELGLERFSTPWHRRLGFWRGFAVAASAALMIGIGFEALRPMMEAPPVEIARLEGKAEGARVIARLSRDRQTLELQAARPVQAGPAQSYELWLIPAEGGAPLSLAVLGNLDARVSVAPAHSRRMISGAKLAVSVEPAGGSPTGGPTGPVILAGQI